MLFIYSNTAYTSVFPFPPIQPGSTLLEKPKKKTWTRLLMRMLHKTHDQKLKPTSAFGSERYTIIYILDEDYITIFVAVMAAIGTTYAACYFWPVVPIQCDHRQLCTGLSASADHSAVKPDEKRTAAFLPPRSASARDASFILNRKAFQY